jgi:hypothetical protein
MKVLVLGASPDPARYSNLAVRKLVAHGHQVIPVGIRDGIIAGLPIQKGQPEISDVHTITIYMNATRLEPLRQYVLSLNPKRIIFNPGAEHEEFYNEARERGIEVQEACTLVMLSVGNF